MKPQMAVNETNSHQLQKLQIKVFIGIQLTEGE